MCQGIAAANRKGYKFFMPNIDGAFTPCLRPLVSLRSIRSYFIAIRTRSFRFVTLTPVTAAGPIDYRGKYCNERITPAKGDSSKYFANYTPDENMFRAKVAALD